MNFEELEAEEKILDGLTYSMLKEKYSENVAKNFFARCRVHLNISNVFIEGDQKIDLNDVKEYNRLTDELNAEMDACIEKAKGEE